MKVATKLLYILKNNIIFIIGTALLVFKGLLLNHLIGLENKKETKYFTLT